MTYHLTDEDREALAERIVAFVGQCVGQADPHAGVMELLAADRAEAERRGAEKALREAATAWQVGGWADVLLPHPEPPANPTIARSSRVLDWLRARADQIGGA